MEQEMARTPNETPIVYVLITLGFLSLLATFTVLDFQISSSNAVMLAGLISGMCALPLGSILYKIMSGDPRIPIACFT